MTLSKFIKVLQKLEAEGHGKRRVSVDVPTLWTGNDTFTIAPIKSASAFWINKCDGDGFIETTARGTEKGAVEIVLSGEEAKKVPA